MGGLLEESQKALILDLSVQRQPHISL